MVVRYRSLLAAVRPVLLPLLAIPAGLRTLLPLLVLLPAIPVLLPLPAVCLATPVDQAGLRTPRAAVVVAWRPLLLPPIVPATL